MTTPRRRFNDDDDDLPMDDTADFVVTDRQAAIHSRKETKRQMEKVANSIWGSLATYASTLSYIMPPRRRP